MQTNVPRGNIKKPRDSKDFVKGISSPIPYVVRVESGDWSTYLPLYEGQKYKFDCNGCSKFSGAHSIETQLNMLMKTGRLPQTHIDFLNNNGYIVNGSVEVSWRFPYALCGQYGNGDSQWTFWQISATSGVLPRSLFDYSMEQSLVFNTQDAQNFDIGSVTGITQSMYQLAKQFLTYFSIQYEWIGKEGTMPPITDINASLLQSPLQIGIPVDDSQWNQTNVPAATGTPVHAVLDYKLTTDGTFPIDDDYQPNPKVLMAGYDISMVTNGVVSPIVTAPEAVTVAPYQVTFWDKVWAGVAAWYERYFSA